MNTTECYNCDEHGYITHVHIYESHTPEEGHCIKAGLTFSYGFFKTIVWNNDSEREFYISGITGYTLFIDDRISLSHAATYKNGGG